VRRQLRQRLWARDGDPGPIAWALASISILLPLIGCATSIAGIAQVVRGTATGWGWVALGAAMVLLDVAIDFIWARPSILPSDQPDLNRPADRLRGRIGTVCEAIQGGRGKIRIGETAWIVEGPDLPVGTNVRVRSANGTVLGVEELMPEAGLSAGDGDRSSASTE